MPSVDPSARTGMYPSSPTRQAAESPERGAQQAGPTHPYGPPGYGGPPPTAAPYLPMQPQYSGAYMAAPYGYAHARPQQHPWMQQGPYDGQPPPQAGYGAYPGHVGSVMHATGPSSRPIDGSDRRTSGAHAEQVLKKEAAQQSVSISNTLNDLERMREASSSELSLAEVKPIQSDFHFFVKDNREKYTVAAKEELEKSLQGKTDEFRAKHKDYLLHSNLNCRLLKAWEDLDREIREEYFKKEEEDRKRFMEDDEVASRHCFTLTARIKSPSKKSQAEEAEHDERDQNMLPMDSSERKVDDDERRDADSTPAGLEMDKDLALERDTLRLEGNKEEEQHDLSSLPINGDTTKRSPDLHMDSEDDESPSKKSRIEEL